jgi:hypothetical protein
MKNRHTTTGSRASNFLGALMSMAVLATAHTALAASDDARYEACPRCEPKNLAWSVGQYDQIHLVAAARGVSHLQPRTLNAEPLAKILAGVSVQGKGKARSLLYEESAMELAKGLVKAMAKAGPEQEAVFFMTSRGDGGFFATRLGNSGTAFIDERGLNLVFGEAHVDFFGAFKATRIARPFDFGSRDKASPVRLAVSDKSNGVIQARADWLIVPLGSPPEVAALPQPTVGNAAAAQAVGDTRVLQSVGANAPQRPQNPAPVTAPVTAAVPVPAARDDQVYEAQETRLKNLKRLRAKDLISEEEYQAIRKEILKDL